jgi:hypothetical protein
LLQTGDRKAGPRYDRFMLSVLRTLAVGAAAFVLIAIATFYITDYVRPPRTSSGHPTMALGHAFLAALGGGIAAVIAMVWDRWYFRRRRERAIARIEAGSLEL